MVRCGETYSWKLRCNPQNNIVLEEEFPSNDGDVQVVNFRGPLYLLNVVINFTPSRYFNVKLGIVKYTGCLLSAS